MVNVRLRGLLLAATVLLMGWMHYWSSEYVDTAGELTTLHALIGTEFAEVPLLPQLDAQGNAEFTKQITESRRSSAGYARDNLEAAYERERRAEFMLSTVSRWATGALMLAVFGLFVSRYRLRLDRREDQASAVSET
jgi:hypothetical protein